jgi:hypothetical protein
MSYNLPIYADGLRDFSPHPAANSFFLDMLA